KSCQRYISSSEVSVALRPFYFAVHPDLFQQHPQERDTNENSLKQLNGYIETLMHSKPVRPAKVKFFLRKQQSTDHKFKAVNISLAQKDIRGALQSILSSCALSTHYIDNLVTKKIPTKHKIAGVKNGNWDADLWEETFATMEKATPTEETLSDWVKRYSKDAEERSKACQPVRDEIFRLQEKLCKKLQLKGLLWACGWGTSHFRGCLQSFQSLITHHPEEMSILAGRTVIFGNESGVSLQGHIVLNSGEVRHNWLDLIRNLLRYETPLKRVPALEKALSRSICEIKVAQRLFRPELLVEAYESHLRMITTSMGDYRTRHRFPKEWPENMSNFHLVVEGEAGPLMLSPSGQFITPSSCPISLLVSFMTANLEEARARLDRYVADVKQEKDLIAQCVQTFGLLALDKDDNVTPSECSQCCNQLLKQVDYLRPYLQHGRVRITHYYSLLSDGEMCIPWYAK
ncbi:T-cell activation inhibitor, mitochondrial-like, partial [Daphnia pulex]|uniref:T-cell activation inhibitor, mitochondrial-like n=1 Tax=Daphnia pulex TaxID=6669 RepID=UPI001EDD4E96